jgi:hypothetical protein
MKSLSVCNPLVNHNAINYERQEMKDSRLINSLAKRYLRKQVERKKFVAVITFNEIVFIKNRKAKQLHLIN